MLKTKQILVHQSKHATIYWMAETQEQKDKAKQALFNLLDAQHCYDDAGGDVWGLLHRARGGDFRAIHHVLSTRQDHEYERWSIEHAIIPE